MDRRTFIKTAAAAGVATNGLAVGMAGSRRPPSAPSSSSARK
jgi:hypothetical protein